MIRLVALPVATTIITWCHAFQPPPPSRASVRTQGFMDILKNAFANEEFDDRRVRASHILVKDETKANEVKAMISDGQKTFAEAAAEFSRCPSAKNGGDLGVFEPGKMVPAFDEVCFDESVELGTVVGPVSTQFGHHLIQVQERFVNTVKSEGSSVF
ncbi:hypothetical protein CTAYLR_004078 [Chrysophaeum taylorii]|uniref:Peptidyl-prolyl cis-trans isomerase n=1 Tax=Chrysophaeum taylorii TaxID=2483200 RepID=A0AAD7XQX1_9STRA|nr:hypothetical protein CTAYLR_004078 [Chrysophaeum taylorii]